MSGALRSFEERGLLPIGLKTGGISRYQPSERTGVAKCHTRVVARRLRKAKGSAEKGAAKRSGAFLGNDTYRSASTATRRSGLVHVVEGRPQRCARSELLKKNPGASNGIVIFGRNCRKRRRRF